MLYYHTGSKPGVDKSYQLIIARGKLFCKLRPPYMPCLSPGVKDSEASAQQPGTYCGSVQASRRIRAELCGWGASWAVGGPVEWKP